MLMNRIVLIFILALLSGCVSTRIVGGYEIFGEVVDYDSGQPIEGVRVGAHFSAIGPFSNNSRILVSATTDSKGIFSLVVPETRLWGGSGGLAGYIGEWPTIKYTKEGYCISGTSFIEPSLKKYQGMKLRLQEKVSGGCI